MLLDTDVLIWYFKGNENAKAAIEQLPHFSISIVTYIELIQGMRNKRELSLLQRQFDVWNVKVLQITEEISARAASYVEQYYLSHSMQLADALIAATSEIHDIQLFTANSKHYRFLQNLALRQFQPNLED